MRVPVASVTASASAIAAAAPRGRRATRRGSPSAVEVDRQPRERAGVAGELELADG